MEVLASQEEPGSMQLSGPLIRSERVDEREEFVLSMAL
jgi:hypothetical protein